MNNWKRVLFLLLLFATLCCGANADEGKWIDPGFAFQLDLKLKVPKAGRYVLDVSPADITRRLNRVVNFPFDVEDFNLRGVALVDAETGKRLGGPGFVGLLGPELIQNGGFEKLSRQDIAEGWRPSAANIFRIVEDEEGRHLMGGGADMNNYTQRGIAVRPNTDYRLSCRAKGTYSVAPGAFSPVTKRWRPLDGSYRTIAPRPGVWLTHHLLFNTRQFDRIDVRVYRYTEHVDDISLRQATLCWIVDAPRSGEQTWRLCYAPAETAYRTTPARWVESVPDQHLKPTAIGPFVPRRTGLLYQVADSGQMTVWFAHNVHKVLPTSMPPHEIRSGVRLSAARREGESFQLALRAKEAVRLKSVRWTSNGRNKTSPASNPQPERAKGEAISCTVRRLVSLPIRRPSSQTRSRFTGMVADPLIPLEQVSLGPHDENLILWVTFKIAPDARPGEHLGQLELDVDPPAKPIHIPVTIRVRDFALPRVGHFRSSFGGQHFLRRYGEGRRNVMDFHNVETLDEQRRVVLAYYKALAGYRLAPFLPHYLHAYSVRQDFGDTISQFVRKDFSGLKASDFDFADFDAALEELVDRCGMNAIGVGHTNGSLIAKMSGEDLKLLGQRYSALAQHLEEKGWLDHSYILIDESPPTTYPAVVRYIDTLKGDPLTARIRICYTIDKTAATSAFDPNQTDRLLLGDRVDIWTPENNDRYNFYDAATYRNMNPPPREVWLYYTRSAHLNIDSPAVNHRLLGWKIWSCRATGFLIWGTWIWEMDERRGVRQPWVDPYTPWGNGVLAFFYPPEPDGPSRSKNFSVVPSVRLAMIREGIEDYEYAWRLRDALPRLTGEERRRVEGLLNEIDATFMSPVQWRLASWHVADWHERAGEVLEGVR